ncbi:MAG: hypothetical protein J6N70_14240 [Oribacterium sp.]|nr:hypothetical protein [Oribacterium sp.]
MTHTDNTEDVKTLTELRQEQEKIAKIVKFKENELSAYVKELQNMENKINEIMDRKEITINGK